MTTCFETRNKSKKPLCSGIFKVYIQDCIVKPASIQNAVYLNHSVVYWHIK